MPNDLKSVGCASSLTMSVTGGAPIRPSASTFQPHLFSGATGTSLGSLVFAQAGARAGKVVCGTGDLDLDGNIDGISGATLSVRALKKLSRLALFLHTRIPAENDTP